MAATPLSAYNEQTQVLGVETFLFRIMSETALHGFLRAVKEDAGLQAQLQSKSADPLALAKSKGFDIDVDVLGRFCVRAVSAAEHLIQTHPEMDSELQSKLAAILSGDA